jgi:hypothetical protein
MNTNHISGLSFQIAYKERLFELFSEGYTTRKAKRKIERENNKKKKSLKNFKF